MISTILFYAGLGLVFISFLMVLRHAFEGNKIWAIVMLLIPVLAIVHIIMFWKELPVRKSLYVLIVALIMTGVGVFGGALAHVPNLPDNPTVEKIKQSTTPDETPLPNEEQAQAVELPEGERYDPILTGSAFEENDIEPLAPKGDKTIGEVKMITRTLRQVELGVIPYIEKGRQVQLLLDDGRSEAGILVITNEEGVVLDQSNEFGSVEFTYSYSKIRNVKAMLSEAEYESANLQASQDALGVEESESEETASEIELEVVSPEMRVQELN